MKFFSATQWVMAMALILSASLSQGEIPSGPVRLTNIINSYPCPSPDGKKVVFQSNRSGRYEIYVMNSDGSDQTKLTDRAGNNVTPVWSPDGSRIVFASNRAGPANVGQLYLVNPDGTGLQQLTTGPWSYAQPSWSPDSGRIFAYQNQETADYEFGDVVVIDVPGHR